MITLLELSKKKSTLCKMVKYIVDGNLLPGGGYHKGLILCKSIITKKIISVQSKYNKFTPVGGENRQPSSSFFLSGSPFRKG